MTNALQSLERGQFESSLSDASSAAQLLTSVTNPALTHRELRLVVAYELALKILIHIRILDTDPASLGAVAIMSKYLLRIISGQLCFDEHRILAGIPLQPKHRVVILRMAINKNMAVGNFGVSAQILSVCYYKRVNFENLIAFTAALGL